MQASAGVGFFRGTDELTDSDEPRKKTTYVVVPTLNERPNLEPLTRSIFGIVRDRPIHLLVVDDGSTDGTRDIAQSLAREGLPVTVIDRGSKQGIGSAIRDGLCWCLDRDDVDCVVTMDADMSHDPADLPRLLSAASGLDLVQGSRYDDGGSIADWPMRRRILSVTANSLVRFLLRTGMNEHTTYFRVYSAGAARVAATVVDAPGYEWAIGSLCAILRASLGVEEVPIHFRPRNHGSSKMTPLAAVRWARYLIHQALGLQLPYDGIARASRFALVGLVGLLINQSILTVLFGLARVGPILAVLVAIEISVLANFLLNDRWTFRHRRTRVRSFRRLVRYHGTCLFGIVANFCLFGLLAVGFGMNYLVANFIGILVGFFINFHGSSAWAWVKS